MLLLRPPAAAVNNQRERRGLTSNCVLSFYRPCSQIDEEIEDMDDVGGHGDDSEMTCISSLEYKQVSIETLSFFSL